MPATITAKTTSTRSASRPARLPMVAADDAGAPITASDILPPETTKDREAAAIVAMDNHVARVKFAGPDWQARRLLNASFALGELVATGLLPVDEFRIRGELADAATAAGMSGRAIRDTMAYGMQQGRDRAVRMA